MNSQPTIKYVAYNPITRKYEEVDPEGEFGDNKVITMYWVASANRWMTVPTHEDEE